MSGFDDSMMIQPLAAEFGRRLLWAVLDLPGFMADGPTREEAARDVKDAIAASLGEARAVGRGIRKPRPALRLA